MVGSRIKGRRILQLFGKRGQMSIHLVGFHSSLSLFTLGISFIVARGQGRCPQKASDGCSPFLEAQTVFRRMWRANQAAAGFAYQDHNPSRGSQIGGPPGPNNESCLMVSAGNALGPGPERAYKTLTFIQVSEGEGRQSFFPLTRPFNQ